MMLLDLVLLGLALPATLASGYLLLLTLCSAAPRPPRRSTRELRFDIIVPAHNEAALIGRTLASLRALDWPAHGYRVLVVADNCTDATAELARAAGATVFERHDPVRRGKGYALDYGFRISRAEAWAHAVAVIDADSEVSPNLLEAFAARIEDGAPCVQARYQVRNPNAAWRTRLMAIAFAAFHDLRSRARARLRLSSGIRGNGWCVTRRAQARMPYHAFSLAEDLEYGLQLGHAGLRVHYADEAWVAADMVTAGENAASQRRRWELGRFRLIRMETLPLLAAAVRRRSLVCLDLAMDLLVLPLSFVALNIVALVAVGGLVAWRAGDAGWFWLGLGCGFALLIYVLRGWQLSGVGPRGLLDLARAPWYVGWKLLVLPARAAPGWVRTTREGR